MPDIVIGHGNHGCSWTTLKQWGSVSDNRVSYLVHLDFLGLSVVVFKGTAVGDDLSAMIASGAGDETVLKWLTPIALKHVDPVLYQSRVEAAVSRAFHDGMEAKAKQMRAVLGMS